jgi:hypothetical protein
MKTYRCKDNVEALRWSDTATNREVFAAWFDEHGAMFDTHGPIALLPSGVEVFDGDWVLFSADTFFAIKDGPFRRDYAEAL